jgi:hypothetical protein
MNYLTQDVILRFILLRIIFDNITYSPLDYRSEVSIINFSHSAYNRSNQNVLWLAPFLHCSFTKPNLA